MFIEKYKYAFLSRMHRPEGLPPKVKKNFRVHLGASPAVVFEISLIVSLVLIIVGFKLFPVMKVKKLLPATAQELVKIEDVEITRQEERPLAPPKPPIVIEAPANEVTSEVPTVSSEVIPAQSIPPPTPKQEESPEEEYFVAVEEMPQLIGGMEALMKNVEYPEFAVRAGIQGRVYVLAYVNEQGEVAKAEVLKGIGGGCDEAALAAVKRAKFIPGKQRGKPVKTRISIPIEFRLTM